MALNPSKGWRYSKQIGLAPYHASYQMKLWVYPGVGTDELGTEGHVYCNNLCSQFPKDIRFGTTNDPNTATQLSQWYEKSSATTLPSASIWIQTTYPSTLSIENIYMFINNTIDPILSNTGDGTFIFFDHFSGASLDTTIKWNTVGTPTVANSFVTLTGTAGEKITSKISYPSGTAFRGYGKLDDLATEGQATIGYNNDIDGDANLVEIYSYNKKAGAGALVGFNRSNNNVTVIAMNELESSMYRPFDIMRSRIYEEGTAFQVSGGQIKWNISKVPIGSYPIKLHIRYVADICSFDWILVRYFVSSQPAFNSFGNWISLLKEEIYMLTDGNTPDTFITSNPYSLSDMDIYSDTSSYL